MFLVCSCYSEKATPPTSSRWRSYPIALHNIHQAFAIQTRAVLVDAAFGLDILHQPDGGIFLVSTAIENLTEPAIPRMLLYTGPKKRPCFTLSKTGIVLAQVPSSPDYKPEKQHLAITYVYSSALSHMCWSYPNTIAAACCSCVKSSQSRSSMGSGVRFLSHNFLVYPRTAAASLASSGNSSQAWSEYFGNLGKQQQM